MNANLGKDGAWGASAQDWAAVQEGTLRPLFSEVLQQTGVGAETAVLDVACGTGLFCVLAAELDADVAGTDASPGQLEVARQRLPTADFREGDLEALPFDEGLFDLVTCCNGLQYAADPVRSLREMRRVARPGATVGILGRNPAGPSASETFQGALAQFRAPGAATGAASGAVLRQPGALEAALATAGLELYASGEVQCDWVYPDQETLLRGVLSFAPGVRAIRTGGVEAVRAAVSEVLAPYRAADGSYSLPNRMRYVLARVPQQ